MRCASGWKKKIGLVFPMYSYILCIAAESEYMDNFLVIIRSMQKDGQLGWQKAYYLVQQLNRFRLKHRGCDTESSCSMLQELMRHAVANCMRKLKGGRYPLPYEKRNEERVVVLTEEFTRADPEWMECVLECCYQLQHILGKETLLVNTAEASSRAGELSYFAPDYGEEDYELCQQSALEWNGEKIQYYQCADILRDEGSIGRRFKRY